MPVSFLSTTQRERYDHYPDTLSSEELARYFHLDDDDREWIATALLQKLREGRSAPDPRRIYPTRTAWSPA